MSTQSPTSSATFQFQRTHGYKNARAGVINTPHGQALTPMFMTVGTAASVKSLDTQDLETLNLSLS